MRIGYARVSTKDQNLESQLLALDHAGCEYVYRDKLTGKNTQRPQLRKMLAQLRPKDVVMVCKLDRLARNTVDLLELVREIDAAGAGFVSLAEPWADTTSPAGTLIITIFAGVAQFERERMAERCTEGRAAAKARGVKFGGPRALAAPLEEMARAALVKGERPAEVARTFGISRATAYRLKRAL